MSTTPENATEGGSAEPGSGQNALRSVHTSNLFDMLVELNCSLAVTTYQAGKLVLVRADRAQHAVNTHFRAFKKPMGMALGAGRLAVGTGAEIWEFRSVPAVAGRIEPKGSHDVAYLPRRVHVTGDIQIHEMGYQGEELWFINTTFSCLCTYESEHSFNPHWRPKFVSAYAPGDRCHLNGLGMVDGKPKWLTALGQTDTPGGWRENKKSGGVLIDLDSDEIVTRGLSMPHSPRWYAGRLWVLESGSGSFGLIDLPTGRYEPIVHLPGFTRGLDFLGNLAFIGLSQVRETAVFSGIPITEAMKPEERTCGVWVIDIRTGQQVAFLKFEEAVQEIFAVSVMHGARFPDVVTDDQALLASSYVLPDAALREVPEELRSPAQPQPSPSAAAQPGAAASSSPS